MFKVYIEDNTSLEDSRYDIRAKVGKKSFTLATCWDAELAKLGAKIIKYRLDYIEMLSEISTEIYKGISSGREEFSFYYDFSKENTLQIPFPLT